MTASPRCTVRMAASISSGGASLSRNPLAPARIADSTYSSRSNVVRTITRGAGASSVARAVICAVAVSPSIVGMRTSMSTTSTGPVTVRAAGSRARTACAPSPASSTTSRSACESMTIRNPARTSCWSSTRATRIVSSLIGWPRPGCSARVWSSRRWVCWRACAGRRSVGVGSWARTRKPPPGRGPALTVPPNIVARSRMPSSPWPRPSESADAPRPSSLTSTHDGVGQPLDEHGDLGVRAGVLEHVGQRLLGDPVDREARAGRQVARLAHADERGAQAAGPDLLDQRADVGLGGLRGEALARAVAQPARAGEHGHGPGGGGRLGAAPQHAEQAPHVRERRPAGLGDGAERPGRRRGVGVGRVPAAVGLRDHHGERVGDDVVHLPGDPGAFGRGRDLGLLVALDLEPLGAVDEGLDRLPARPPDQAERPDGEGAEPGEDRGRRGAGGVEPAVHRDAEQDRADERADDRDAVRPPGPVHGDGVQGEQDGEVRGDDERGEERELEEGERVDRDRGGRRTDPAPGQGGDDREGDQRRGERARARRPWRS